MYILILFRPLPFSNFPRISIILFRPKESSNIFAEEKNRKNLIPPTPIETTRRTPGETKIPRTAPRKLAEGFGGGTHWKATGTGPQVTEVDSAAVFQIHGFFFWLRLPGRRNNKSYPKDFPPKKKQGCQGCTNLRVWSENLVRISEDIFFYVIEIRPY